MRFTCNYLRMVYLFAYRVYFCAIINQLKYIIAMITTINWHLLKACNMECKFCYATFNDIKEKKISKQEGFLLLEKLWNTGLFKKINFAGGEPMLIPYIDEYIIFAKKMGFETSIVTNGSKITQEWLNKVSNHLDILGLSVDSIIEYTNILSGRAIKGSSLSNTRYYELVALINHSNIKLKINTVVNSLNKEEIMTDFINFAQPFRWKILQATAIKGQNDSKIQDFKVCKEEYSKFIVDNEKGLIPLIEIIKEEIEDIQGSYLMIDLLGRFYESSTGQHRYSDSILDKGVVHCLNQITPDYSKFINRKGDYTVNNN
jgi:radical S-adenosyl methionine domain-containing protein 2